jgi:hypothetical protein
MTFATRPDQERWDRDRLNMRNRAIIRAQRRPCARCGKPIAYDEPYWLTTINGRKTVNPRAFHCGHIRSRINGGGHELANLQAEHAGCSIRSGPREANRRRRQKTTPAMAWPSLDTSRRW